MLGSLCTATAGVLLPQEQAIADDMINNSGQGRPYLVLDPIIQKVAEARAMDMAVRNYFAHVNPDGVAANYLLRQAGYVLPSWWGTDPTDNYVESIAAGYASPSDTWTAWMNSPPHKEHLLAQNSFFATETHFGVAYYYDPNSTYKYYWVVITAPPEPVEITSPAPSAKVNASSVAVTGMADTSTTPASIQFRVENSGGIGAYQPATGIATWSGTASGLVGGANLIRAQSLDSSGNVIAETTSNFTYVVESSLTVSVSGSGAVSRAFAGTTTQEVGETIKLNAVPAAGFIFAGWTGSITSSQPEISFSMQPGMSLQANFVPTPFIPISGAYYGLLTSGSAATQSGLVRMAVSSNGIFTGKILLSGSYWSFTGALGANGTATITIPHSGTPPWVLTVQSDLTGGSGLISGSASNGVESYDFSVSQSTFNAKTNAATQAGRYTLVLPPDPSVTGTSTPQGSGYAAIVVSTSGVATVAGRLADGTAYSTSGHLANDGTLALFFAPSGAPKGSAVNGLLKFQATDSSDLSGNLAWTRRANAKELYYPAGFQTVLQSVGSRYVRPVSGLQPLAATVGTETAGLGSGNLPQALTVPVVVTGGVKATMLTPGSPDLKLAISPETGVVSGTFMLPDGNVTSGVHGVVLQKQNAAYGYFRGINQFGAFCLNGD